MSTTRKVTHQGKISLLGGKLKVYVVNNKRRTINIIDVHRLFNLGYNGTTDIPEFISYNYLKPYIAKDLKRLLKGVEHLDKHNNPTKSYDSDIIVEICNLFLEARRNNALKSTASLDIAERSELLLVTLAKLGMVALIDEATDFELTREDKALQTLLDNMLRKSFANWAKVFPDEFYQQIYRLKEWTYNPQSSKRPRVIGKYTNDLVYERLMPEVLEELKYKNPTCSDGKRDVKHHQWLSVPVGHPRLREHLKGVLVLMRVSNNWNDFIKMMDKAMPKLSPKEITMKKEK